MPVEIETKTWGQAKSKVITRGVSHTIALSIYIKKYVNAKKQLWKL
jgi:hypothetical protein